MIKALLFDLDGTLADSEEQTDRAILEVMARHGSAGVRLPPTETRGRSWADIARELLARHPVQAPAARIAEELLERWSELVEDVRPIPGAAAGLQEAAAYFRLAIVSSSPRSVIDRFADALGIAGVVAPDARIGADGVKKHKPDPEGFLLAASRLGATPAECVVFEDSSAGLHAARAAGMASVGILHVSAEPDVCRSLATATCAHYDALPPGFWAALHERGAGALAELLTRAAS